MAVTAVPRDTAMAGGAHTRGFWTQRKRTSSSLLCILALISSIAVAFKLFEQDVPNNIVRDASTFDYVILARDDAAGETAFRGTSGNNDDVIFRQSKALILCAGQEPPNPTTEPCNVDQYPGDERMTEVLITNTNLNPVKPASFDVFVDPASIVVSSYDPLTDTYAPLLPSDPFAVSFSNYWSLRVEKQTYFMMPGPSPDVGGEYENDPTSDGSYVSSCGATQLSSLGSANPCKLGTIRANGNQGIAIPGNPEPGNTAGVFPERPVDDRQYRFFMVEDDDGSDQSTYLGWRISFTLVFRARLIAESEQGRFSSTPVRDDSIIDPVCSSCP